jgi:hypothetical protein
MSKRFADLQKKGKQKKVGFQKKVNPVVGEKRKASGMVWDDGDGYNLPGRLKQGSINNHNKHRHKNDLMDELHRLVCGSKKKAEALVLAIAKDLEMDAVTLMGGLPDKEVDDIWFSVHAMSRATTMLAKLRSYNMTDEARTAVCVFMSMVAPPNDEHRSVAQFKRQLGIHTRGTALYTGDCFKRADEFRRHHARETDECLDGMIAKASGRLPQEPAPVDVGGRCRCVAGVGTLSYRDPDGRIGILLEEEQVIVHYDHEGPAAEGGAGLARQAPSLLPPQRRNKNRPTKPLEDAINAWHANSGDNVRSPNKKDVRKKRIARGHVVEERTLYRFLTWVQLWLSFSRDEPALAAKVGDPAKPLTVPTIFRNAAPWNLVKGKEKSCLCLTCEELECKSRAQRHVVKKLEAVLARWKGGGTFIPNLPPPPPPPPFSNTHARSLRGFLPPFLFFIMTSLCSLFSSLSAP